MKINEWSSLGYVPLVCNGKVPTSTTWSTLPPEQLLIEPQSHESIGIRAGDGNLIGVDIDIQDASISTPIIQHLTNIIGVPLLQRVGQPPKTLIPLLCNDIPTKLISPKYINPTTGTLNTIEILSKGQQFVVDGIHPDTNQPYTWNGNIPHKDHLPWVTCAQIKQIFAYYDLLAIMGGWALLPIVCGRKAPKQSSREYIFNHLFNIGQLLTGYHWVSAGHNRFTRPGKRSGVSATTMDNTCYIFSSSTQFDEGTALRPYDIILEYGFKGNNDSMSQYVDETLKEYASSVFTNVADPNANNVADPNANTSLFAFNSSDNKVYEISKPARPGMIVSAFKKAYGLHDNPWLIKPEPVIVGTGYHPAKDYIYYDDSLHGDVLNKFRFPIQSQGTGTVNRFLDLTQRLWGIYTPYILDLLASIIQEPQRRIQVMPLLVSGFGAGKDTWINYFKACIGYWNCSQETLSNIAGVGGSDWGNWAKDSLLCVCSEAETTGKEKYSLGPAIRDKITNNRLPLNLKYGENRSMEVFTSIIAFTNLNSSVLIPRGDRRIFIHRTDSFISDSVKRVKYFTKCYAEINDPSVTTALMLFLKSRNITNDPYGHAPITDYKKLLMSGENEIEEAIIQIIDKNPSDLILSKNLRNRIQVILGTSIIDEKQYVYAVTKLLSKAFGGKQMRFNGSLPQKVYSLRNPSKWLHDDPAPIRMELES